MGLKPRSLLRYPIPISGSKNPLNAPQLAVGIFTKRIKAYHVQLQLEGPNIYVSPFDDYLFTDARNKLIFGPQHPGTRYIRPLEDGKPVSRPIRAGDICQVYCKEPHPDEKCEGEVVLNRRTYKILSVETPISGPEFEKMSRKSEQEYRCYARQQRKIEREYDAAAKKLEERKYRKLPSTPPGLEERLAEIVFGKKAAKIVRHRRPQYYDR